MPSTWAQTPAAILAETPGNGALSPGEIRELKIEHKTRNIDSEDDFERDFLRITIESVSRQAELRDGREKPNADEARAMAASVFGPVVR